MADKTPHRPNPPSTLIIQGHTDTGQQVVTRVTNGRVTISAVLSDADAGKMRLMTRISANKKFPRFYQTKSGYVDNNKRATLIQTRMSNNTLYYGRAYTQDKTGRYSKSYNSFAFWTNRTPISPVLVQPLENASFLWKQNVLFDWQHLDPDSPNDDQGAYRLEWRRAGNALVAAGSWAAKYSQTKTTTTTVGWEYFQQSQTYEWRIRTRDQQGFWGPYSLVRSFYVQGRTLYPQLLGPGGDTAVLIDTETEFKWRFRDPGAGSTQSNADMRYRVVGAPDDAWVYIYGSGIDAKQGVTQTITVPEATFFSGYQYEWQMRTVRATGTDPTSDWSPSSTFWTILTPGSLASDPFPLGEGVRGQLGCGVYRVFVYERGGEVERGLLTGVTTLTWNRKRDDISTCSLTIDGYDFDCAQLLRQLRTWHYEIVIFRDDDRVWEGPITHLTYTPGQVNIDAKDVMVYLYRRIMRQGYNDRYHLVNGVQDGLKTVTERAGLIIVNALAYADPNVLPYLTMVQSGSDAKQSKVVYDYTRTAWEEIDDLAANSGLDYTVVGRRIIVWDTHRPLGQLMEMRDDDFSEPLTVTEYGMSLSNYFATTDGQGTWGAAIPAGKNSSNWTSYYGPVEMLASQYGDVATVAATTPSAVAALKTDLTAQAKRNINGRYPAPVVARVPDNATIQPSVNVTVNQLVPGVWVPLRVEKTVRPFAQMQKLDSITVTVNSEGERIGVVMSPAPGGSDDPDADAGEEGDGGDV